MYYSGDEFKGYIEHVTEAFREREEAVSEMSNALSVKDSLITDLECKILQLESGEELIKLEDENSRLKATIQYLEEKLKKIEHDVKHDFRASLERVFRGVSIEENNGPE